MDKIDHWTFTVVRTHGLSFLRPEKSWRPIVTVTVDEHQHNEVLLGNDGQNPNLRAPFHLRDVHIGSKVDIKLWQKSQTKKKKKPRLVATASHSLGELVKRHELAHKVEIRLNSQQQQKRGCATRGKPQNGAVIVVKVVPPGTFKDELDSASESDFRPPPSPTSDRTMSDSQSEDDMPIVEVDTPRIRGYLSDSDSDILDNIDAQERKPLLDEDARRDYDDEDQVTPPFTSESTPYWLFPSLLPSYTEKIEVDPSPSFVKRVLSSLTMYNELREACLDSHFEAVFERLRQEWTFMGGLLIALAAVDTAIFSISAGPDSLFNVDSFAQGAVAASSVTSGLGITCDAWFLLRYNWADLHTFRTRAKDLYGSYFFFALSARLPSFGMLISALSLMAFLGRVAYNAWPAAVIVICVMFGVVMSLQFLVFGAHWCIRRVVDGCRITYRGVGRVFQRDPGQPPPYESS